MLNKNEILTELYNSQFIDDVLQKLTSGHHLKDDLKSELFLILTEMSEVRIKKAYTGKYLNYMSINILKKQYHSKSSPFHNKWRKDAHHAELVDDYHFLVDDNNSFIDDIMIEIRAFVENELDIVDKELFKIYYKVDRYDRFFGDLKDTTCKKRISSTRKIEKKLAIKNIEGQKKITIDHATIALSLRRTYAKLKEHLENGGWYYDI